MLTFYRRVATRFYALRRVLWVLGAASVAAFTGILFLAGGAIDGSYALAALSMLLWSLWALALAYCFVGPVPVVDPSLRLSTRLAERVKLILLWILAVLMAGLMVVAVILTVRTIGIVLDA